jgi:hypothetical protein
VKFLYNIQPNEDRAELASSIADKLRDYLKETDKIKTVHPHTRLSGSYSRYTAVKKIKDVDVLLFVSNDYNDGEESIKEVINDLINALKGFPEYLEDVTGYVKADLALKRQRRSVQVHITLNGQEFDVDVVPSIAVDGLDKPILVPDRDLSKWVSSDPLGYGKLLSKLNKENTSKVVPLIKMFKHWRDAQMKRMLPKSYWLECMVCRYINAGKLDVTDSSWGQLFLSLMNAVLDEYSDKWKNSEDVPVIKDPMLNGNVAKSWSRNEFSAFMNRIEESKRLAERALEEDDEDKAIKLWQQLFNDDGDPTIYFPSVVEESLTKALSAGSLIVSSSGQILPSLSKAEKSWQSPVHRSYGDYNE